MRVEVGDDFQKGTKYYRKKTDVSLDWSKKPDTYKSYPSNRRIQLSLEFPNQTLSLVEVFKKRKSIRSFSHRPLCIADLSFLLWASTGVQRKEHGYEFRTAPSAGGLYPIETYIIINNVEDLEKALHHYNIALHSLEELKVGDFAEEFAHAALENEIFIEAPVLFIWTAIFERSKWKYAQRAYRYIYLDAGHIAQNLALSATSIGLGSCQIGAFFDEEVNKIIEVDGTTESAIYLSVVGHPK